MSYLTPAEAAIIIGISKKTLLRWDEEGRLPVPKSLRDDSMNSRKYLRQNIEKIRDWRKLRKEERVHLRKLPAINKEKDRFIATTPIDVLNPPKMHSYEEMKNAYANHREWIKIYDLISKKQAKFSEEWLRRIPDDE